MSDLGPLSSGEGGLAQLGEHLLCKQGVVGSIPSSSTTLAKRQEEQAFSRFGRKKSVIKDMLGISQLLPEVGRKEP